MLQDNDQQLLSHRTTHRTNQARRLRRLIREHAVRYQRALVLAGACGLGLVSAQPFGTTALDQADVTTKVPTIVVERASPPPPGKAKPKPAPKRLNEPGVASYYSASLTGNPTASGEPYDPDEMTAAHRTLPLGTRVRVTNVRNGKSVVVRVNDRGPFISRRIIDLSHAAARQIGMLRSGTARVKVEKLTS